MIVSHAAKALVKVASLEICKGSSLISRLRLVCACEFFGSKHSATDSGFRSAASAIRPARARGLVSRRVSCAPQLSHPHGNSQAVPLPSTLQAQCVLPKQSGQAKRLLQCSAMSAHGNHFARLRASIQYCVCAQIRQQNLQSNLLAQPKSRCSSVNPLALPSSSSCAHTLCFRWLDPAAKRDAPFDSLQARVPKLLVKA